MTVYSVTVIALRSEDESDNKIAAILVQTSLLPGAHRELLDITIRLVPLPLSVSQRARTHREMLDQMLVGRATSGEDGRRCHLILAGRRFLALAKVYLLPGGARQTGRGKRTGAVGAGQAGRRARRTYKV